MSLINKFLKFIDGLVDKITMYRLVLYYVAGVWAAALLFSFLGYLPYSPYEMVFSAFALLASSLIANALFANVFDAPSNIESVYITAGILALIISPTTSPSGISFMIWASIWAMASKYIFAIRKKHVFNPAAIAVVITALTVGESASWWVANLYLLPFVALGGIAMVRKIHRADLVYSYFGTATVSTLFYSLLRGSSVTNTFKQILVYSPMIFFASVMLTEPMTTPPRRAGRVAYGVLVGFLFAPFVHFGSVYSTPEIALVIGNIFSYLISPKVKAVLRLKEKIEVTPDVYDFVFENPSGMVFKPGQYMEWTLGHEGQDSRGIRRYFTIASSPTEDDIRVGVKFYENSSSYKQNLMALKPGDSIVASQLSGDFTLPRNKKQKLVFIAGGIGITPFRSMIKYLLDRGEWRDLVLFYSNRTEEEFAYAEMFEEASDRMNFKNIFTVSRKETGNNSKYLSGRIDNKLIMENVPDWQDRTFYISGPQSMVNGCKDILQKMGVQNRKIKTDYFPGLA